MPDDTSPFPEGLPAEVAQILAGRRKFTLPPDPDTMSAEQLFLSGLPPRPDPDDPAYELWATLRDSRPHGLLPLFGPLPSVYTTYNRMRFKSHLETSRNWSGAVIAAPFRAKPFWGMLASWTVTPFSKPPGGKADTYACSTWIGFDGHRRLSRSLPQAGTLQRISPDGKPNASAWMQWWWDGTAGPTPLGLDVAVGDRIVAALVVVRRPVVVPGPLVFIAMAALSPPKSKTKIDFIAELMVPPDPSLEVAGLDAECILERPKVVPTHLPPPYDPATLHNYRLPGFEDVPFECYAFQEGRRRSRDLHGSRILRMIHTQEPGGVEGLAFTERHGNGQVIVRRTPG